MGKIISLNSSPKKKVWKKPVPEATFIAGMGVEGDAHAGPGDRQVSLLMMESIERQREQLKEKSQCLGQNKIEPGKIELVPGVYAENITTIDIDLIALEIGDELIAGEKVKLRVSKIGKECHTNCAIYHLVGDCVMPKEGIFCEVVEGGALRMGDTIEHR